MRKRHLAAALGALAALGLWLGAVTTASADGMRCGNRLVSKGDSTYDVRARCGEPQGATRRTETRTERRRVRVPCGGGEARCDREQEVSIEVVVDEWTYDFGPQRFMQYLTFLDGKLARVETGSYGSQR
jgi:hypothetical protein